MEEIIRMQENLLLIRRTVGWTAEEFGDRIGVTRQTINNIESGRSKLTKTQYIAMRSVLDAEMIKAPDETGMLKILLDVLVDNTEKYSKESRNELLAKANLMAPSILAGTASRANVSKEWMSAVAAIIGAGMVLSPLGIGAGIAAVSTWLVKSINESKNKTKMILWCLKDNEPSKRFYTKMGGEIVKERTIKIGEKEYLEVGFIYSI